MKKSSYIGLAIIIVIFAVIVVPKIFDRFINNATVDSSRSIKPGFKALDFIKINGDPKKVPEFLFLNQDSIYVLTKIIWERFTLLNFSSQPVRPFVRS